MDFVRFVANTSHQNIVVDENVNSKFNIVLPSDYNALDSMQLFNSVLQKNGFVAVYVGKTLYVRKISELEQFRSINLFFELPEPIIKSINQNYPDLKVSSIQKSIVFKSDEKTFNDIRSLVDLIDRPRQQRKLKVMMISFNDSDLKERGFNVDVSHAGSNNLRFSSAIGDLTVPQVLTFANSVNSVAVTFSMLDSLGLATLHLDNVITLNDGKDSTVRSIKTIPYLSQENNVDGNQNVSTNSYSYKDVGTEINLSNVSVLPDSLFFQASFKYEQILNDSITPVTSKREVINYLKIPKGQSVLISGIKSKDVSKNNVKIPLLSDIPLIGSLFQYQTDNQKNETFAIYLENLGFDQNETEVIK